MMQETAVNNTECCKKQTINWTTELVMALAIVFR